MWSQLSSLILPLSVSLLHCVVTHFMCNGTNSLVMPHVWSLSLKWTLSCSQAV